MKNNILKLFLIIFINNFIYFSAYSIEQFNFDVTEIEILNNGNTIKGIKKGEIKTDNGITIIADTFVYEKLLNILTAKGNVEIIDSNKNISIYSNEATYNKNKNILNAKRNVKIIDSDKNISIYSNEATYNKNKNILNAKGNVEIIDSNNNITVYSNNTTYHKNEEKVVTKGKTNSIIKSKYNFESSDIIFLVAKKELSSEKKSVIKDDQSNVYYLDKFFYSVNDKKLKGNNIIYISNFNLPESDKFYFSNGIIDLENNNFIAKDTKAKIHKNVFGDNDNDPRLKGVSSRKDDNIITIKKGVFTSCAENESCPPWSIKAEKIRHNKNKKQLIYDNAFVRVYDIPVFYFPKFFHPDPTVKRQSGLLRPQLNYSNILGNSLTLPYFYAADKDKDYTFKTSVFDKKIKLLNTEFRKVSKNSYLITDVGLINGYKSTADNKKKNINHFFGKYELDLNFKEFETSDLSLSVERTNNDTYLKIFESHLTKSDLRPQNFDILKNEIELELNHENYDFTTGFTSYENLHLTSNDRYQYILPYYRYNKNLSENYLNGSFGISSTGTNELRNTNNLRSTIANSVSYRGLDLITDFGLVNNFNANFKNFNSLGKKDPKYKNKPQIEGMSDYELVSSLPLIKTNESFEKTLTPKLSFRFSPNNMKDNSSLDRKIDVNNIFANNRLGLGDSLESGRSLTIGIDYKKTDLKDINKYFDLKLATVVRDKEENFLPNVSTLNRKTSNLFGSISTNFTEYVKFDYNFAIDNDLKTLERNSIKTSLAINKFTTTFNFLEESGEMGDINTINNTTRYQVDDNNYLTFNTRRNRKINLTEFYDLVYEYKNDCLTAAIKYNKTYYQDRDIMPTENLFFTITLFPLTTIEQKIDK